jgi:hypothetical protein
MARKTGKGNIHEYTRQIHSTKRKGTEASGLGNWNEHRAKVEDRVCCHDCRYFNPGCRDYLGMYHKPCGEFEWW